jgi:hypothetical protein
MVGRAVKLYRDAVAAGATTVAEAAVHLADHLEHIEGLLIGEARARVRAVAEAERLRVELRQSAAPRHVCTCPVTARAAITPQEPR